MIWSSIDVALRCLGLSYRVWEALHEKNGGSLSLAAIVDNAFIRTNAASQSLRTYPASQPSIHPFSYKVSLLCSWVGMFFHVGGLVASS